MFLFVTEELTINRTLTHDKDIGIRGIPTKRTVC